MRTILRFVGRIGLVLPILEDGIERVESLWREQADFRNESSDRASRESTAREADEEDLVAVFVVLSGSLARSASRESKGTDVAEESISGSDVFTDAFTEITTDKVGECIVHAPETGLIVHDLRDAISRAR